MYTYIRRDGLHYGSTLGNVLLGTEGKNRGIGRLGRAAGRGTILQSTETGAGCPIGKRLG